MKLGGTFLEHFCTLSVRRFVSFRSFKRSVQFVVQKKKQLAKKKKDNLLLF